MWENPRSRGEKIEENEEKYVPWKSNVSCQRFFTRGAKSGYFQVNPIRTFSAGARPEVASSKEGNGSKDVRDVSRSRSYSIRSQGIFLSYSSLK